LFSLPYIYTKPPRTKPINLNKYTTREIALEIGRKLEIVLVSNGKSTIYTMGKLENAINHKLSLAKVRERDMGQMVTHKK
jgi:hypothetical protein